MEKTFIYETSNQQKVKTFFVTLITFIVFTGLIFTAALIFRETFLGSDIYTTLRNVIEEDIKQFTPIGLFYLSFISAFFFTALPFDLFFYFGLQNGNPFWISLVLTVSGMLPSMAINYYVGLKFSPFAFMIISRKRVYKIRRWVNKRGSLLVYLFNLTPFLPGAVLTFALGIARYDLARLFTFLTLGTLSKLLIIGGFYFVFIA